MLGEEIEPVDELRDTIVPSDEDEMRIHEYTPAFE